LKTYASSDIEALESGDSSFSKGAARQRLVLLDNVARCQWAFLNPQSGEWEPLFNEHLNLLQALKNQNTPGAMAGPPMLAPPPGPGSLPPSSAGLQTSVGQPTQVGGNNSPTRPGLVELNLEIGGQPNRRIVFWAPPCQIPTQNQTPGSALTPLPAGGLTPVNTPTPALTPVAPTR